MLVSLAYDCKPRQEKLSRMATIHERIKKKRLAKGWSMEDFADKITKAEGRAKPLAWQTIQQWENGSSAPNRKRLQLVARLLETTVAELLGSRAVAGLSPEAAELAAKIDAIEDPRRREDALEVCLSFVERITQRTAPAVVVDAGQPAKKSVVSRR